MPAISSNRAPISIAKVNSPDNSLTCEPTACTPRMRWSSSLATILMNPPVFSASIVRARPFAASGNLPVITGCPASFAASGDNPTSTISGSVKTIAGTATGSQARISPAITSATISP